MGDEIVLDSEGEGDSKVRIGGLREKEILSLSPPFLRRTRS